VEGDKRPKEKKEEKMLGREKRISKISHTYGEIEEMVGVKGWGRRGKGSAEKEKNHWKPEVAWVGAMRQTQNVEREVL